MAGQASALTAEELDRIRFSFNSKNSENVVAPCLVQIFVSQDQSSVVDWQFVTTGVVALLRSKENLRKGWKWNISLAIADKHHGMCVWRDKLVVESFYTVISDSFHVFAISQVQGIVGLVFESLEVGRQFGDTYRTWFDDKLREDGTKGRAPTAGPRFSRDMISRPCNFQHISGSAALAQIQQVEEAKQAVGRVIASIGPRRATPLDCADGEMLGAKRTGKKKGNLLTERVSRFEHMKIPHPSASAPVTPLPQHEPAQSGLVQHGLNVSYSQEPHRPTVVNGYQQNPTSHDYQPPETQHVDHPEQCYPMPPHTEEQHKRPHSTSPVPMGDTYRVEDIDYDYDEGDDATGVWRESVMEGTNWEDEILQAFSLRTGVPPFAMATTGPVDYV